MSLQAHSQTILILAYLRGGAIVGQIVALMVSQWLLALQLNGVSLSAGILFLACFNVWVLSTQEIMRASPRRVFAHLLVDMAQLAWMIAWSGGAMNPFVSLFLVPVALASWALPAQWMFAVAGSASVAYGLSVLLGAQLPHIHRMMELHLWGMAINFLLSCAILVSVLRRLAQLRDQKEQELANLRESASQARALLQLATHAAALAHSLNTPLGTLTLALEELALDAREQDFSGLDDVERAIQLVAICRDHVRALVRDAQSHQQPVSLSALVEKTLERWRLMRPEIALKAELALSAPLPQILTHAAAFAHVLHALLDNAADASLAQGKNAVTLSLRVGAQKTLQGQISDQGGAAQVRADELSRSALFVSAKPGGLGLGLAVCRLSMEQWRAHLHFVPTPEGISAHFEIPLSALSHPA